METLLAHDQPGLFAAIGELDWYAGSHQHWIDDVGLRSGDRVLEVGCATGALTRFLAESGYRVTGLDRSVEMISRARRDHSELEFREGDAAALGYGDNTFDAVVAASLINIIDDAEVVLSEMHRVCAPGGIVSVLVPAAGFTDGDLCTLIETLGITGFSEAALTKWHRGPAKMSASQLGALLRSVRLDAVTTGSYLNGMVLAATATVWQAEEGGAETPDDWSLRP